MPSSSSVQPGGTVSPSSELRDYHYRELQGMNQRHMILKRRRWNRPALVPGAFVLFSALGTVAIAAAPSSAQAGGASSSFAETH